MKTSAIILRVADFLKGFPPFSYLPEEALLELAQSGRVKFCEKGEILFEEGDARGKYFFVINKGTVRLVRGANRKLSDLRGAGDFVGAGILLGEPLYTDTALVDEDSILYALDAGVFGRVCAASRKASRFLVVYFATEETEVQRASHAPDWFRGRDGHLEHLRLGMVSGPETVTIREAARAMTAADTSAFVVLDAAGRPQGVVTETDLCNEVATGNIPPSAPVGTLMRAPVLTTSAAVTPGDSLLGMIRHGVRHLCVTEDGTENSRALGVLSDREVALSHSNNPLALVREIRRSRSPAMLHRLNNRLGAMLLHELQSPDDIPWCARVASEARRAMFRRAEAWAREAMRPQPAPLSIALAGSAGRGEPLTQTDFPAVILFDGDESARSWMLELLQRIDDLLDGAGFQPPRMGDATANDRCRTAAEWTTFFCDLVKDPMAGRVWQRMTFFDLSTVCGDPGLLNAARLVFRREVSLHPEFIRLLANDALGNLPPVTIFEGFAVDADGLMRETVDIKDHALTPLSDVARVFHLDGGEPGVTNTLDRLAAAAVRIAGSGEDMTEAGRAFRIAQYFRALNGLRNGNEGDEIRPSLLSRTEQVMLKAAFRDIAELIGFTRRHYGFGS